MSPVLTIFRKELRSYVMTPYGWVILAFVMALQTMRLILIIIAGPKIASFVARRIRPAGAKG